MSTKKLYYADSHLRSFTAEVLSCARDKSGWLTTIDNTAFYPEGGGQPCDRGTLGGAEVLDVREKNGELVHLVSAPLPVGARVEGELDWARRFDLMQQHSGEHIVSGLICARFGCDNVGFHIGAEEVTIDFNAEIGAEELEEIERVANAYVWENREVEVFYPTPDELAALRYRSKKALEGEVRIVRFPGADCCACCGTHVKRSGEVGLVKLLGARRFREGVRIELVCGGRALKRFARTEAQNAKISNLLSAKPEATAAAVERLQGEAEALRYRLVGLELAAAEAEAEKLRGAGDVLLLREGLDAEGVRRLAAAVFETSGGVCAVFSGADGDWKYALGAPETRYKSLLGELNAALQGRGGGRDCFAQGSVKASRAEIESFFAARGIRECTKGRES